MKNIKLIGLYFLLVQNMLVSQRVEKISSHTDIKYIDLSKLDGNLQNKNVLKPVIQFLAPAVDNDQKSFESKVNVFVVKGLTYTKDGSGIKNFKINDHVVGLDENDRFEKAIVLSPGNNKLVFTSTSKAGGVCADTISIYYYRESSKNYIFQIAIDKYSNWPELSNPVTNAESINKVLLQKYGFNEKQTINLFNTEATRDNIYEKFQWFIKNITPEDKLIIVFSGHGHYDEAMGEGFWVPCEARKNKASDYITNSEIVAFVKAINAKHTLLIADACFAGSMMELAMRGEDDEINYHNFDKRKSRWVFTSGGIEKVQDQSLFAEYLIKFLEENTKPYFLFTELTKMVISAVGANSDQMPVAAPIRYAGHEGGQFIFELIK